MADSGTDINPDNWTHSGTDGYFDVYKSKVNNQTLEINPKNGSWFISDGPADVIHQGTDMNLAVRFGIASPGDPAASGTVTPPAQLAGNPSSSQQSSTTPWSSWGSEGDGSGTVERQRMVNGQEEIEIKDPGDKTMLDGVIGAKGAVLSSEEVPVSSSSPPAVTVGPGNAHTNVQSDLSQKPVSDVSRKAGFSGDLSSDENDDAIAYPGSLANPTKNENNLATTAIQKPVGSIDRSAGFSDNQQLAAGSISTNLSSKQSDSGQSVTISYPSKTPSVNFGLTDTTDTSGVKPEEPAPAYTGGAEPVKTEQLNNGATVTTTSSGAVVEQMPGQTPYTVKAAPPTPTQTASAVSAFMQEEGKQVSPPISAAPAVVVPDATDLKSGMATTPATPASSTINVVTPTTQSYYETANAKSNDMISIPASNPTPATSASQPASVSPTVNNPTYDVGGVVSTHAATTTSAAPVSSAPVELDLPSGGRSLPAAHSITSSFTADPNPTSNITRGGRFIAE